MAALAAAYQKRNRSKALGFAPARGKRCLLCLCVWHAAGHIGAGRQPAAVPPLPAVRVGALVLLPTGNERRCPVPNSASPSHSVPALLHTGFVLERGVRTHALVHTMGRDRAHRQMDFIGRRPFERLALHVLLGVWCVKRFCARPFGSGILSFFWRCAGRAPGDAGGIVLDYAHPVAGRIAPTSGAGIVIPQPALLYCGGVKRVHSGRVALAGMATNTMVFWHYYCNHGSGAVVRLALKRPIF